MPVFDDSDIIGFFNWSEITCATGIWEGIIRDILPQLKPNKERPIFFDLADCSKRSRADLLYAFELVEVFNHYFSAILSLNENETCRVFDMRHRNQKPISVENAGDLIYRKLKITTLISHPVKYSIVWAGKDKYKVNNLHINTPKLSTGGGDNFNAGYCLGQLWGPIWWIR